MIGYVYDCQGLSAVGMAGIVRERMGMDYPDTAYYMDVRGIRQVHLNVKKNTQEQESGQYVELSMPHAAAKIMKIMKLHYSITAVRYF